MNTYQDKDVTLNQCKHVRGNDVGGVIKNPVVTYYNDELVDEGNRIIEINNNLLVLMR